ncbi:MAG TPA: hypothetical protein VFQ88_07760 [Nevskiaceae bacterium]|nr:hypothetical protein [Nevskiaceae bacterium]
MIGATINFDGDTWRILGVGAHLDGYLTCHLASTTRFRKQRNGRMPVQEQAAVPAEQVEDAMRRPRGFFLWNRALRGAFEEGAAASSNGGSEADCPYASDKRRRSGLLTWSRGFRTVWLDGFRYEQAWRAIASCYADARP